MENNIELINCDCREYLFSCEPETIDLTVTSPPYDNLRTYNNSSTWGCAEFTAIASGLWRVTKPGGVVVWVVNDATIKGSETGTSFKQALFFKELGFNLHDTMIYIKNQLAYPDTNRYYNAFEYMYIFAKGQVKTFNPIKDRRNVSAGRDVNGKDRTRTGCFKDRACAGNIIKEFGTRWNYWLMFNLVRGAQTKHPATFPEQLAHDHIISWSNKNDVVFDPMMGSGTTGRMALQLNRRFIGIEIDKEYFEIAKQRIQNNKRNA